MAYGILKVDTVTFTDAGIDKSVTLSGLVQNPTFSGNVTVTGTLSGVTVTGTTANFTSGNFTNISGGTHTITSGVFAAGSAASPSITFTGDLNTGIYSPGADQVSVTTGGTERLRVDATGQIEVVSLGTAAAPAFSFTTDPNTGIYSPGADQVAISTNSTGRLFIDSSGNGRLGSTTSASSTTPVMWSLGGQYTPDASVAYSNLKLKIWDDGTVAAGLTMLQSGPAYVAQQGGHHLFYTSSSGAPTERMRLDSSGRLGVGNSIPGSFDSSANQLVTGSGTGNQGLTIYSGNTSTGNVYFADGTAGSAPYIGFIQYRHSDNRMDFGTNDGTRMSIDASGRLGIGTSTVTGYSSNIVHINGATGSEVHLTTGGTGTTAGDGLTLFTRDSDGAAGLFQRENASLLFGTNDQTRVAITSGGAVGIGSSTPTTNLTIADSANFPFIHWNNSSNTTIAFAGWHGGTAGGDDFRLGTVSTKAVTFQTNNTERGRWDASGRLLVGTSSTSANCRAIFQGYQAGSQAIVYLSNNSANPSANSELGSLRFSDNTHGSAIGAIIAAETDLAWNASDYPTRLVFSTTADGASSPTERMRITNNGFLKISNDNSYTGIDTNTHGVRQGTGANWTWMTVNDTVDPFGIRVRYLGAAPNGTGNPFVSCADTAGARFEVRSNGGIANYSGNNVNLSDINSKKDISPAAGTWDCIKEWEIVNYRYKDQPDDADLNLGVIAQQVAESCPEVITVFEEAKDDQPEKLGVKEQQMYWMAIKALQEAQVRIETLEAEVAALKAE